MRGILDELRLMYNNSIKKLNSRGDRDERGDFHLADSILLLAR